MDAIFIKKIKERWRVWLGSLEDADPQPAKCDARFLKFSDAKTYARDWEAKSGIPNVRFLMMEEQYDCG